VKDMHKADSLIDAYLEGEKIDSLISEVMAIEPGGLRKLGVGTLNVKPGVVAYLGASSSPSRIIITKVDDRFITYRQYPYKKDARIDRAIGEDLIRRGTESHIRTYGSHRPKETKELKSFLAGKPKVVLVSRWLKDQEPIEVHVRPADGADFSDVRGGDPWYAAERYGGVGMTGDDYVIHMEHGMLKDLKKEKRFKILKTRKR
jgi:hypothetical protein